MRGFLSNHVEKYRKGVQNMKLRAVFMMMAFVILVSLFGCGDRNVAPVGPQAQSPSPEPVQASDPQIVQLRSFYRDEALELKLLAQRDDVALKLRVAYGSDPDTFTDLPAYPAENCFAWFEDFVDACVADVNGDGTQDLLVVATFCTGLGEDGMTPYPHALVYTGTSDGLALDWPRTQDVLFHYDDSLYDTGELAHWLASRPENTEPASPAQSD